MRRGSAAVVTVLGASIDWTTVRGESVRRGDVALVPESRALAVRLPWAAFVWHRPTAVRVEGGSTPGRLPIHDVTRLAQLGITAFGLLALAVLTSRREERAR